MLWGEESLGWAGFGSVIGKGLKKKKKKRKREERDEHICGKTTHEYHSRGSLSDFANFNVLSV